MHENPQGPQVPYGTPQPGGYGPPQPYPGPFPQGQYGAPVQAVPFLVPAPPGARYDHLARNRFNTWWRPIVGTLIVGAAFFAVGLAVLLMGLVIAQIAGIPAPMTEAKLFDNEVFSLAVTLLSIAAVLPVVYGTVALIQRRPPGTLSSVTGRLRWSWMAQCFGLAIVAMVLGQVALAIVSVATGEGISDLFGWAGWERFLPSLIVILLLVPFQAATEEYLFRGWLLQAFGAYLKTPWPGLILGAAAFTALHGYTDWGIVDVFSFGVLMGWLAVRTGGLEAAIAMHVVNNTVAFGLSASAGTLEEAMQQGSVPWQSLAGTVVQLGVFTAGVLILAKKRSIATISG